MADSQKILLLGGGAVAIGLLYSGFKKNKELSNEDNIASVLRWTGTAKRWAEAEGVDYITILAMIWQESSGLPQATGSSGEKGLMQLKDIAFKEVGIEPTYQASTNIEAGTKFYSKIKNLVGSEYDSLRAYNKRGTNVSALGAVEGSVYANQVLEKKEILAKELGKLSFTESIAIASTQGAPAVAVAIGNKVKSWFNGFFN